jgi:thioesterase domain-containing protein
MVIGSIVTTILSLVILRSIKYFEKKQDSKAEEVKQSTKEAADLARIETQKIAEELTIKNEERAQRHRIDAAAIAEKLKRENAERDEDVAKNIANNADRIRQEQMAQTQKISEELRVATAKIAHDLETKTDTNSKNILLNINDVDKRLSSMIDSIKSGTIGTNDNVSKIRNDILELQGDVDHIYDKINHEELQTDPQKKIDRERKRKIRKKEISNSSLFAMPARIDKSTSDDKEYYDDEDEEDIAQQK